MSVSKNQPPYSILILKCVLCPNSSGVNTWRDQLKPTQLLQNSARFKGYPAPVVSENGRRINYGRRDYTLDEFGEFTAGY